MARSGKIIWWAVGICVVSLVIFLLPSIDGRHLRATSTTDPIKMIAAVTALISALTGLITGVIAAIDKLRSKGKDVQTPAAGSNQSRPEPNDREDYETPRGTRPSKRFSRGDELEYVRPDWRDDRFNLVEIRRFVEYDYEGYEVWTVVDKYRELRKRTARRP
jgi:hypothetical protein